MKLWPFYNAGERAYLVIVARDEADAELTVREKFPETWPSWELTRPIRSQETSVFIHSGPVAVMMSV